MASLGHNELIPYEIGGLVWNITNQLEIVSMRIMYFLHGWFFIKINCFIQTCGFVLLLLYSIHESVPFLTSRNCRNCLHYISTKCRNLNIEGTVSLGGGIWMCRRFDPLFWHSGDWTRSFWGIFSHPLTPKRSFGVLKLPIPTEFDLFGPKFHFSLNLFGSNFQRHTPISFRIIIYFCMEMVN